MISFFRKLRWLAQRDRKEADLEQELQFHLEEEAYQRKQEGAVDPDAMLAARREFGNLARVRESTRAVWGWTFLEQLGQDLRYALRAMLHNRGFTALSALTLALGIGANTAIYSFLDAILLRSLPVSDPRSLALLNWHSNEPKGPRPNTVIHGMDGHTWDDGKHGTISGVFPYAAFELLQQQQPSMFSSLFAYYPTEKRNLSIQGLAQSVPGEYVSGDYFRGLGVQPAAGRLIVGDDDRPGAPLVAMISFRLSQRRFGSASSAVGQTVLIDNLPFTIIGVTPPEFFGVDPSSNPDFYAPLRCNSLLDGNVSWAKTPEVYLDRNHYWLEMMGRLRPGVSLAQAQSVLAPIFHQWVAGTAKNDRELASLPELMLVEGGGGVNSLRRQYTQPLYLLLTMVGLILAIACANNANLLLSRAAARRREMAVRLSVGAGRLRIVRQLLTESILLASAAGALGLLLAFWGMRFLTFLLANGQEDFTLHAELNWHVLATTLTISILCGAAFGLAPAVQAAGGDVIGALKNGRAAETDPRVRAAFWRISLSQVLVVAQIVISVVLLAGAGLFARTLANLQSIPMGFNRENVLLFELNARQAGHSDPEILAFYEDLRARFASIPGSRGATLSHASLLNAGRRLEIRVGGELAPDTWILHTGPRFLSTMQIPLIAGREINEHDQKGSPGVVVVNERFARRYFGNESPLGRRIVRGGQHPRDMEIIGVASNAHYGYLRNDVPPLVYIPYNQEDSPRVQGMVYAVRTTGDPLAFARTVRETVRQADSRIPVMNLVTQAAAIDRTMNQEVVFSRLSLGFAVLALIIAGVGLYGTMAYAVTRRTGEIGVRMALGAPRAAVVRMILRQSTVLAIAGVGIGVPAALAVTKLVKSFLYGIKSNDPLALTAAAVILMSATLVAGCIPAWRASRIDPLTAIRRE